jgi:putative nucleotidyltransferase with HDIG domain
MPTQPPSQLPSKDSPSSRWDGLKALPHHLAPRLDLALGKGWVRIAGLTLLLITLTLLMGPSFRPSGILGQSLEVGTRAESNIKATRDFHYYPSKVELAERREAAADRVLPVFDHRVDLTTTVLSRVNKAFQAMTVEGGATAAMADRGKGGPAGPSAGQSKGRDTGEVAIYRRRFAKLLHSTVAPQTFARLRDAGFSPEVRATVILLVDSAMTDMVVGDRKILQLFKGAPIAIRHMVGGQLARRGEKRVTDLSNIRDVEQVREHIRHQAAVHGARLPAQVRSEVVKLVQGLVEPNLVFNPDETNKRRIAAREAVDNSPEYYAKGRVIVPDGDEIKPRHLRILREMEGSPGSLSSVAIFVGIALFGLVTLVTLHRYGTRQFRRFAPKARDLVTMGVMLVALLALTRAALAIGGSVAEPDGQLRIYPFILPIAAGAMLIRLVVSAEAAGLFAISVAALCGLALDKSLVLTLFYLLTGLVGAYGLRHVQSRTTVLRAGLWAGVVGAGAVLGLELFAGQLQLSGVIYSMLWAIAGGILSAFVTLALLPAVEWAFAYTTDISLLELANLNHPLLRELMLRAPGTYHHSMVVGSLAEAACEAIGANGLLARVASNFHDVGKMKNAAYFAENFRSGDNPHNRLKPSMSGLIIRNHVKDGIEMMRQHGIPDLVIDTASQHHGTALIAFFYHKALEQKDPDEVVLEADYRYPGPKPQTREAGVLMLADGVEAAARSLAEPTEDRVRALVQRIINTQFTDSQLDHCDLTLRDLHVIARSFLQVLRGIYHARPTYPWQRGDDGRRAEEKKGERRKEAPVAANKERSEKLRRTGEQRQAGSAPSAKESSGDRVSKKKTTERKAADAKPDSPGKSAGATEPQREDASTETSAPDIRRLGLN